MKWKRWGQGYICGQWSIEPWDELVGRGTYAKRWRLFLKDQIILHHEERLRDCKEWAQSVENDLDLEIVRPPFRIDNQQGVTVGHLMEFLRTANPEALVVIGDGWERVRRADLDAMNHLHDNTPLVVLNSGKV